MAKGRAHINVLIAWAMAKSHVLSIGQHLADFKSCMTWLRSREASHGSIGINTELAA